MFSALVKELVDWARDFSRALRASGSRRPARGWTLEDRRNWPRVQRNGRWEMLWTLSVHNNSMGSVPIRSPNTIPFSGHRCRSTSWAKRREPPTAGTLESRRPRNKEGQEDQLGAMGLVVNAIVLWNTRYMDAVLSKLQVDGDAIADADVRRLSPLVPQAPELPRSVPLLPSRGRQRRGTA